MREEVRNWLLQAKRDLISRYPDVTDILPFENYDYEIANDLLNRTRRISRWLNTQIKE